MTGRAALLCVALLAGPMASPAAAQDDEAGFGDGDDDAGFGDGDDDAGFGDEGDDDAGFADADPGGGTAAQASLAPSAPSPVTLAGFLRTDNSLWTERLDDQPLAKARQSLDLSVAYRGRRSRLLVAGHGEYDLAWLIDRDGQDVPSREIYARDLQLREAFIGVEQGAFDLTVGRQIVAWGEGDALSPVDVVNPRDMREPGLSDLDDIRLPVLATRLGYFHGDHRFEVMAVHEPNWGLRSPPFGEFSPLPKLLANGAQGATAAAGAPVSDSDAESAVQSLQEMADKDVRHAHTPDGELPDFDAADHGWFARWVHKGDAMDLGLYAASLLHQQGVFASPRLVPGDLLPGGDFELPVAHERYTMLGHSGATASGSWLIKWEAAVDLGRPVNVLLDPAASQEAAAALAQSGSPLAADELDALTPAIGITYTGLTDASVTVEAQRAFVLTDPAGPGELAFDPEAPVVAVRSSHKFLREDLTVALAATVFGASAEQGWLARGEVSYKLADGWKASLGYITYQPGDDLGLLSGLDTHDRVFAKLRWDFQLGA